MTRRDNRGKPTSVSGSYYDINTTLRNPTRDPVDTYKRRDLRSKISKEVKALSAALVTPSDKKHIPKPLTGAMADFLKEFTEDTSVFSASRLAVLKTAYDRLSENGTDGEEDIAFAYDPDISANIAELSETIDGRRMSQLDMDATQKVYQIVRHFKHLVNAESKIELDGRRQEVAGLGKSAMAEANRQKAARETGSDHRATKAFTDMLTSGNITPPYFFKRLGGTMEAYGTSALVYQLGLGDYEDQEDEGKSSGRSGGGRSSGGSFRSSGAKTSGSSASTSVSSTPMPSSSGASMGSTSSIRRARSGQGIRRRSMSGGSAPSVNTSDTWAVFADCRFNSGGRCKLGRSGCGGCNNNPG